MKAIVDCFEEVVDVCWVIVELKPGAAEEKASLTGLLGKREEALEERRSQRQDNPEYSEIYVVRCA